MSRTLKTHVSIWGEAGELVVLAPGDELPDWAVSRVGEHCLVPGAEPEGEAEGEESEADPAEASTEDGGSAEDDAAESEASDEQPNFTAPAPARRGRPRK
ncbi:hypothetical protein ABC337_05010 [Arthrobacter sp. 1P04PC]|uniref:hypothetical protein n=1 Tax=unclassified Arthrobacter TaxID=235627 RepID=UPI00399F01BC